METNEPFNVSMLSAETQQQQTQQQQQQQQQQQLLRRRSGRGSPLPPARTAAPSERQGLGKAPPPLRNPLARQPQQQPSNRAPQQQKLPPQPQPQAGGAAQAAEPPVPSPSGADQQAAGTPKMVPPPVRHQLQAPSRQGPKPWEVAQRGSSGPGTAASSGSGGVSPAPLAAKPVRPPGQQKPLQLSGRAQQLAAQLSLKQLQDLCAKKGLSTSGTKAQLAERLLRHSAKDQ